VGRRDLRASEGARARGGTGLLQGRRRSPQEFIALQSELARDAVQQAVETSRRIGQVSMRVADEAADAIQARANTKPDRVRRVA
jgi:hypothetical protein